MKRSKSWLAIIGSFIFLVGIGLISYDVYSNTKLDKEEEEAIEEFYVIHDEEETINEVEVKEEKQETKTEKKLEYIAVIKIPKIGLERGLVDPKNKLNNVNYNLAWVDGTSMPDEVNGNVIIAGHSGTA